MLLINSGNVRAFIHLIREVGSTSSYRVLFNSPFYVV